MTTRKNLVGTIREPGLKPRNVDLVLEERPVLTDAERAAGVQWVNGDYQPGDPRRFGKTESSGVYTLNVPTDFATLQLAMDLGAYRRVGTTRTVINIETGHALTGGLLCENGDFSHVEITADDATVSLHASFVGAEPTDTDTQYDDDDDAVCVVYNANGPIWGCVVDMDNAHGRGITLASHSRMFIRPNCGVINAGDAGLHCRASTVFARATTWDGANYEGIRVEQEGDVSAQFATADDCVVTPAAERSAAVFASRNSRINFISGSATGSGEEGCRAQRSRIVCEGANFSYSTTWGIRSSHASIINARLATVTGCGTGGCLVRHGGVLTITEATVTGNTGADLSFGASDEGRCGTIWASGTETSSSSGSGSPHEDDCDPPIINSPSGEGIIWDGEDPILRLPCDATRSTAIREFSSSGATNGKLLSGTDAILDSSRSTTTALNHFRFYNPNGEVGSISTSGSATAFNTSSDERLKDFLGELSPEEAVQIIKSDPARKFLWRESQEPGVGWGAQTSYEVSPDLASPGDVWGMDYGRRTPYLWAAVSYLLDEVERLKK